MPRQHRLDGDGMPLRQPQPLRVFVHDERVAVAIAAAQQANGVVGVTVIQRRPPLARPRVVEVLDDMHFAPQRREELARGDVPIAVQPGAALPTAQALQHLDVLWIVPAVVSDARGDEPRLRFRTSLPRFNESLPIPAMPHAARVGGRIDARSPVRF